MVEACELGFGLVVFFVLFTILPHSTLAATNGQTENARTLFSCICTGTLACKRGFEGCPGSWQPGEGNRAFLSRRNSCAETERLLFGGL